MDPSLPPSLPLFPLVMQSLVFQRFSTPPPSPPSLPPSLPPFLQELAFVTNHKARRFMLNLPKESQSSLPFNLQAKYPDASPEALALLRRMLVIDPAKRITVAEALEMPYLSSLHDPVVEIMADSGRSCLPSLPPSLPSFVASLHIFLNQPKLFKTIFSSISPSPLPNPSPSLPPSLPPSSQMFIGATSRAASSARSIYRDRCTIPPSVLPSPPPSFVSPGLDNIAPFPPRGHVILARRTRVVSRLPSPMKCCFPATHPPSLPPSLPLSLPLSLPPSLLSSSRFWKT